MFHILKYKLFLHNEVVTTCLVIVGDLSDLQLCLRGRRYGRLDNCVYIKLE